MLNEGDEKDDETDEKDDNSCVLSETAASRLRFRPRWTWILLDKA